MKFEAWNVFLFWAAKITSLFSVDLNVKCYKNKASNFRVYEQERINN